MNFRKWLGFELCLAAMLWGGDLGAQPFGIPQRVNNTTLRLPPRPPVANYTTTNAFIPHVFTTAPTAISAPPRETNRLFIAEQGGRIVVITNLTQPTRTVFLDISSAISGGAPPDERGLLGLAFHPGFATNRYFYVFYSTVTISPGGAGSHQRISRFEATATNRNRALPASEAPVLTLFDRGFNHNGGDLQFGPDGYLYVSLGDEGGGNDSFDNGQMIDRGFWSGILRLDVDNRATNFAPNPHPAIHTNAYRVPRDNPFVGLITWNGAAVDPSRVRTEFYAVGLRNPWRMSFDPPSGRLYCGDVGQDEREEINLIVKGGNYGWSFREGRIAGPKSPPPGVTAIDPILDYGHTFSSTMPWGISVTGGVVYRGARWPQLFGAYIFADYYSGLIMALRYDGTNMPTVETLATSAGIAAFGIDPSNGDVLIANQDERAIQRLVAVTTNNSIFPPTLADTGAFANLVTLTPQPGVQSYDVNLPFWSDGASKRRWFSIPAGQTITYSPTGNWRFPTGSVWVKHFELELTNGVPSSRRRLETRFLVRDDGDGVYGITYRWNAAQTGADLVPESGLDETFQIRSGNNVRSQVWHYPSRAECLLCHNRSAPVLGFNTAQLHRDHTYANGVTDNQLRSLDHAGYFDTTTRVETLTSLRALMPLNDETVSLEERVRSYLAANCSFCHQPGGMGQGFFDVRLETPLDDTRLVNGPLLSVGPESGQRVVVPLVPSQSILLQRIFTLGAGRMPPVASRVADLGAVAVVRRWITSELPRRKTFSEWQYACLGSTNDDIAGVEVDLDGDGAGNYLEYLAGTDPLLEASVWRLDVQRAADGVDVVFPRVANRGFLVEWTDSIGLPSSWRVLDVPGNRLFFASTNGVARVRDASPASSQRMYRARVILP